MAFTLQAANTDPAKKPLSVLFSKVTPLPNRPLQILQRKLHAKKNEKYNAANPAIWCITRTFGSSINNQPKIQNFD
jgi:hypothetical protein